MGRQHIHFATGLPGCDGVISGMRFRSEIFVYLNVERIIKESVPLFVSDNGVLLSPGIGLTGNIPMEFVLRVMDASGARLWPAV